MLVGEIKATWVLCPSCGVSKFTLKVPPFRTGTESENQLPFFCVHFSTNCFVFFILFFSLALASGGSLPITPLDASGNLVFANAGGTPNIVTAPLFLNPQNLSLFTSSPISLVSAASAGAATPITSFHAATSSFDSIQNSLFTMASASGPASTTTTTSGSKAQ